MLSELFKTDERVKILNYILCEDTFTVIRVSRATGVTKGLVSRYLRILSDFGLITRTGNLYRRKDSAQVRAAKVILNLDRIDAGSLDLPWAEGLGIFGSWAKGTNTKDSDFDVWVTVKTYPSELDLARLQRDLRSMVSTEVSLLVLTDEKVESIKESDRPFYNSLVYNSLVLRGEPIEPYQ